MSSISFSISGKIVYDPFRAQMKKRTEWWAVIEVDKEITRYCRHLVEKEYGVRLLPPAWDAHVSIIRGESIAKQNQSLWKKYHGQSVDLKITLDLSRAKRECGKHFWFVDVECQRALDIRAELGRPSNWPPHLTIGREPYDHYIQHHELHINL